MKRHLYKIVYPCGYRYTERLTVLQAFTKRLAMLLQFKYGYRVKRVSPRVVKRADFQQ